VPGDLLTTTQAGEMLGVSRWTISRWIGEGRLPAVRLPTGRLRIRREDVELLIQQGRDDVERDRR
jgi:iron complex outermembrane recepter protein